MKRPGKIWRETETIDRKSSVALSRKVAGLGGCDSLGWRNRSYEAAVRADLVLRYRLTAKIDRILEVKQ